MTSSPPRVWLFSGCRSWHKPLKAGTWDRPQLDNCTKCLCRRLCTPLAQCSCGNQWRVLASGDHSCCSNAERKNEVKWSGALDRIKCHPWWHDSVMATEGCLTFSCLEGRKCLVCVLMGQLLLFSCSGAVHWTVGVVVQNTTARGQQTAQHIQFEAMYTSHISQCINLVVSFTLHCWRQKISLHWCWWFGWDQWCCHTSPPQLHRKLVYVKNNSTNLQPNSENIIS